MKTFAITLSALGLAFSTQAAHAAPRCSMDSGQLDSAFLIIKDNGEFCEGAAEDQARLETELTEQQARADAERLAAEKRQLAEYKAALLQGYRQSGMSPADARKYADQAAREAESAALAAERAAHEAKAQAAAGRALAANQSSNSFAQCAAGMRNGTSACAMPGPGNIAKAIRPGMMAF
jgi:hypothetical protein